MASCVCPVPRSTSLQARPSLVSLLCSTGLLHFLQHHSHTVLPVWLLGSTAGCVLVSTLAPKHAGVYPLDALSNPVFLYWRGLLRGSLEEGVGNTAERIHWKGTWGFESEPSCENVLLICVELAVLQNLPSINKCFSVFFSFQVLSLAEEATVQEISHSYRELARMWHPDHNPSKDAEAKFMRIHEAYEVLLRRHKPNRFKWSPLTSYWLTAIVTCRATPETLGPHIMQRPLCVLHEM